LYVRDRVAYTTAERLAGLGGNPKAAPTLGEAPAGDAARMSDKPDADAAVVRAAASAARVVDAVPVEMSPMTALDLGDIERIEASVQAFPWTRRNFADALAAGYDTCVLRRAGRVLGFCILMHAPDVSHLLVIAVDKTMHRQGLGSRLIAWCVDRSRQRGIEGLLLEVRPSNEGAIAFYVRHGFRRVGLRRGYYPAGRGRREDAVVMQKAVVFDGAGDE
jgi:tRNA threonylcarbamoyladenosine biosynthesis protein TsaB